MTEAPGSDAQYWIDKYVEVISEQSALQERVRQLEKDVEQLQQCNEDKLWPRNKKVFPMPRRRKATRNSPPHDRAVDSLGRKLRGIGLE